MPIVFQSVIRRADLRANRGVLYLFGDNEQRAGLGGQAKDMRGEPNAVGIRTKHKPSLEPDSFWVEGNGPGCHDPDYFIALVENDFASIRAELSRNKIVIIPMAGIGTGLARLDQGAPITFRYLRDCIAMPMRGRFETPSRG